MTTPLFPQPEPPSGIPPGSLSPKKLDGQDGGKKLPQPPPRPLEASSPVLQDKTVKAADLSTKQTNLGAKAATQAVGQKILMPFDDRDPTKVKIAKLSQQIDAVDDPAKDWPFRLERARLYFYNKEFDAAIADLNQVENYSQTPDVYNWQAMVSWKRGDWAGTHQAIDKRVAAKEAIKMREPVQPEELNPQEFQILNEILRKSPSFAKAWKEAPLEWRAVLMTGYKSFIETPREPDRPIQGDIYRYLKGGILRFNRLYNELALTTQNDVEKLWRHLQTKDLQKTDRVINRLMDFVFSAGDEDRPELLKTCLNIASKYDNAPATLDSMAKAFAVMKRIYPANPEVVLKVLTMLNSDYDRQYLSGWARDENLDSTGEKIFELKEPFGPWDMITRLLATADRMTTASPELQPHEKISSSKFNNVCKIASELGDEASARLIDEHWVVLTHEFLLNDVIESKRTGILKKILDTERQTDADLVPMFIQNPDWMDHFAGNEDLFRQYRTVMKNKGDDKLFFDRLKQNPEKLKEVFNIASDYPTTLIWLLTDDNIFDKSVDPDTPGNFYHDLLKMRKEPVFIEYYTHALLNLVESNKGQIALDICKIANPEFRNRLLDLMASGDVQFATDLLNASKSPKESADPLMKRILAQTNSQTAPIAKALLQLKKIDSHTILDMVVKQPVDQPFSKLTTALMALHAQGDEEQLAVVLSAVLPIAEKAENKRTPKEKAVVKLVEERRFTLAREFLAHDTEAFWKNMIARDLPADKVQLLRDLHVSLKNLKHLTHKERADIEAIALRLVSDKKPETEKLANAWLFLCLSLPTDLSINDIRDSYKWEYIHELLKPETPIDVEYYMILLKGMWLPKLTFHTYDTLANSIAKALVTPGGGINPLRIPFIISELDKALDKSINDRYNGEHLQFVLEQLKNTHYFSERLESLKLPPKNSRQDRLLTAMCGKDYTLQDARKAALGALLWPLRQGEVGSCFATAIAIQMDSSADGLKQSFEDILSILTHGSLTRKDLTNNVSTSYPIVYDPDQFAAQFSKENHLARVREFTMSSMGGEGWKETGGSLLIEQWNPALSSQLGKFKMSLTSEENDLLKVPLIALNTLIGDKLVASMSKRYIPFAKSAVQNYAGGWAIVDSRTEEPLIASRANFENVFLHCIEEVKKKMLEACDEKQKKLLGTLFDDQLPAYIHSDQFLIDVLDIGSGQIPTFFKYDPSAMKNNALTVCEGGNETYVMKAYQRGLEQSTSELPPHEHPWKRIFKYIKRMSSQELNEALKNPRLLVPMFSPGHAMNLKIGAIFHHIVTTGSLKAFEMQLEKTKKMNTDLLDTPLDGDMQEDIVKEYYKLCDAALLEKIKSPLEKALKGKAPRTVKDLCRLIVRTSVGVSVGDAQAKQKALIRLKAAVSTIEALKDKIPPLFDVVDPNWGTPQGMSLCFDLNGTCKDLIYTSNVGAVEARDFDVYPIDTWKIHKQVTAIDDISRSYCAF